MEVEAARRRGLASTGARAMQARQPSEARTGEGHPGTGPNGNLPASTISSESAYSAAHSYSTTAEEESSVGGDAAPLAHPQRVRHPGRGRARGQSVRLTTGTRDHAANEQHSPGQQPVRHHPRRIGKSARGASSAAVRSPPPRRSRRNATRQQQEASRPRQSRVRRARKPRKQLKSIYGAGLEVAPALAQVRKSTLACAPFLPVFALVYLIPYTAATEHA